MSLLSLNCWVVGDSLDEIFTIEISRTKNISILKEIIKEKNANSFGNFDSKQLDLWKVCLPPDNLDTILSLKLENHTKLSPPTRKLSKFFDEAVDEGLHVAVKRPPEVTALDATELLSLNCFVLGDEPDRMFTVKVPKTDNVSILKDMIKAKNSSSFGNVDSKNIDLWMADFPIDDLPTKKISTDGPKLGSGELLLDVFPSELNIKFIHVTVYVPVRKVVDEGKEFGRRDQISALEKRYQMTCTRILNAISPSDSAKSATYPKSQITYNIYDGRYNVNAPRSSVAPPVELFHSAFACFLDDIERGCVVPENIIRKTVEYMKATSGIFASETERRITLSPLLCDILGVNIQTIQNDDKTTADGTAKSGTKAEDMSFSCLFEEDKNEFGDGGSDPSTQAGLSAVRSWAQKEYTTYRNATTCPSFLIATAGPWFAILGLVFTDCVIIQRLTDFIWVGLGSVLNEARIKKVARIFYALRTSLEKLRSYYENLKPAANLPAPSRYFPSLTTYSYDGKVVQFEYVGFLEDGLDCTTLRAQTCAHPAQDIVVKFVDHYGERAHRLLAENGLAPTLFYYGSPCLDKEPSYHSLSMVVMDYIDGDTLAQKGKLDEKTTQFVRSEVLRAIKLLHLSGLVFGDLRPPNVIITKANEVKLIDFNWAGEEGQAKYPCLISSDIKWAAGVEALGVIKKDHDMEMFNQLFL